MFLMFIVSAIIVGSIIGGVVIGFSPPYILELLKHIVSTAGNVQEMENRIKELEDIILNKKNCF